MKLLLRVVGMIFFILGILGIVLPLLPATPFFLLAAACWAKSSPRLYNWLIYNRWFGKYIRYWRDGKGIPLKAKILATILIILTIGYCIFLIIPILLVKILLAAIAIIVICYILSRPTAK